MGEQALELALDISNSVRGTALSSKIHIPILRIGGEKIYACWLCGFVKKCVSKLLVDVVGALQLI